LSVQAFGDTAQAKAIGCHPKDLTYDLGFRLVDLESNPLGRGGIRVPKAPAAGVESIESPPFESTMGLLRELFDVEGINQAVHSHQHVGLFILRINALRYRDDPNTYEVQLLEDPHCVAEVTRQSARIIEQNNVEWLWNG
jgi:hypothetical protein